jgi:hypothetical protein
LFTRSRDERRPHLLDSLTKGITVTRAMTVMRGLRLPGVGPRSGLRAGLGALLAAGLTGGLILGGLGHGYPQQQANMLSGAAWLASDRVGQLTLLDGTSAEVAAQVQVAPDGGAIGVAQQGATAYAVNRTTGTVRRVNGATFDVSPPATPLPGAGAGLMAFAAPGVLDVLDTQRGLFTDADPITLAPRIPPIPLTTRLAEGTAVVDTGNRLWLLDQTTGDLIWITDHQRHRRQAAHPGHAQLTLANGNPVVVDPAGHTASTIDPATGLTTATTELDLHAGDTVSISGSDHANRLYLVTSAGVLDICDLTAASCDRAVPLSTAHQLGAPTEAGNRLFVPDYTTGSVWVIDLDHAAIIAEPQVLTPPGQFQLLSRDGIVFFNDPNSERAGVIRLDGTVATTAKYDPGHPTVGLHVPGSGNARANGTDRSRAGSNGRPQAAGQTLDPPGSQQQTAPPPGILPTTPGTIPLGGSPPGTTPPTTTPPPGSGPPNLRITLSKATPTVDEGITLRVGTDSGQGPASAQWDFGDGQQSAGVTTIHHWGAARTYQVSVTAMMPDGQQATTSLSITVTPVPKVKLTVSASANGSVTGTGVSCPGTCSVQVDPGTRITLTARAGTNFVFSGWGGSCGGTATTCTVTMNTDKTVSAAFSAPASAEDCRSYDPATLAIVPMADTPTTSFVLRAGAVNLDRLDTMSDANGALSVARGFNQHCFIGQPDTPSTIEYWKGGNGVPGPTTGTSCVNYDPSTLTITQVTDSSGTWYKLHDANDAVVLAHEALRADAERALLVFQAQPLRLTGGIPEHQAAQQCFLGQGNQRNPHYRYVFQFFPGSNTR